MLSYMFIGLLLCTVSLCTGDAVKQEKICSSCKFFTNKKDILLSGKCLLFPKIEIPNKSEKKHNFLILQKPKEMEYYHCSTARGFKDMCGEEGSKYEENEVL